ncbi:MAG: TonB C-terminal domain-containing protein [Burkholderiales bacterium]
MLLDDDPSARETPRWLKPVLIIALAALLAGVCTALVMGMFKDTGLKKKRSVQEISLVRPPPPPPPPKPEEKLPEPEVKEEVKIPEDQPEPENQQAEQPPPGEQLGVDAQGSGNGDSFGLLGKPGGRDVTTIGGGDKFAWYAGVLRAQLQKALARNDKLRGAEFKVIVRVWVEADGTVKKAELMDSTGDSEKDKKIQLALAEIPPLRDTPPADLPQPIRFRLSSTY